MHMVVACNLASVLAVAESAGPAFTSTVYGWSTTKNSVFWFGQAFLGFGAAVVLTGGVLEKRVSTGPHLRIEMLLVDEDPSNAVLAQALAIVTSAIGPPITGVSSLSVVGGRRVVMRIHLPAAQLKQA